MHDFDVVVAGGGVAGSISAAALAKEGFRVLICEQGLPGEKRLAGELMHPPAAKILEELDLLQPLQDEGAAPVYGFAIFEHPESKPVMLSYSELGQEFQTSIALEHARITHTLLDEVKKRDGIEVWKAKVVDVQNLDGDRATVLIRRDGQLESVNAALVVSAQGRASKIRDKAGIPSQKGDAFRMVGWKVPNARIPYPGFGHVFIADGASILAYQMDRDTTRVMIELDADGPVDVERYLEYLPQPFRQDVEDALKDQRKLNAKVWELAPSIPNRGRLAVVGDAGGCVHPLTATGISFCAQDGERLAKEVARGPLVDVPAALERYAKARRNPMRVRLNLGRELVHAFSSSEPSMKLLRSGLFDYWRNSEDGRKNSLALLATTETRPLALAKEYARVAAYSVKKIPDAERYDEIPAAISGIARRAVAQVRAAIR